MAASAVSISREEYLRTAYRPDRDWIEGELRERNLGEQAHAVLQNYFAFLFRMHARDWNVRSLTEQRVQVLPGRYRVPDVCVVASQEPYEPILHTPPLLAIEILSREDRMSDIQERIEDYLAMGIPAVWVVDPVRRKAYSSGPGQAIESVSGEFAIPGTAIHVPLADLFAELDSIGAPR